MGNRLMGCCFCASSFVGGCFRSWVFVSVCARSSSFVCIRFHSCVVGFICARSFWCGGGAMLVSWWRRVAVRGVDVWWLVVWSSWGVVATCSWRFVVVCCCGSCDVTPASHVKKEVGGQGVIGLTCMNSDDMSSLFRRRGTSSSPWAGVVTWC